MDTKEQDKLNDLADNFVVSRKYLHAVQIYHRLLDETGNINYKLRLFETYLYMRFREASDKYFFSILDEIHADDDLKMRLASMLMSIHDWEKLIEVLSLVDAENRPEVNFILGMSYFKTKDFKFARHYLEKFLKSDGKKELKVEAVYHIGIINYFENNFQEAIELFKESEFFNDLNSEFYYYFASAYRMLGMYTHASLYITKALRLDKKDPNILLEAGKIYNKLEQFNKSEKYLELYSEVSKNVSNDYLLTLAETYIGLKQFEKAEMIISLFDKEESDNPEVIAIKQKISSSTNTK